MTRCPICYTVIEALEKRTACPECQHEYHATCWSEVGGCGTYGCKQAAVAVKPPPPVRVGAGWGDVKSCPSCQRSISSSLLICGCGARFPWADPITPAEYMTWMSREQELTSASKTLIILFVITLLGVPAPVTGPIAGFYAFSQRKRLAGAHGTFLTMGYGSAALGGMYLLLIVLLSLGS